MTEPFALIRHQHIEAFSDFNTEIEAEDWAKTLRKEGDILAPLDLAPGERPTRGARVAVDRLGIATIVRAG